MMSLQTPPPQLTGPYPTPWSISELLMTGCLHLVCGSVVVTIQTANHQDFASSAQQISSAHRGMNCTPVWRLVTTDTDMCTHLGVRFRE